MTAVQFAFECPERTAALVLVGGNARFVATGDFPLGLDPSLLDEWIDNASALWGTGALVEADAPTVRLDDRYRAWAARLERHACTPGLIGDSLRIAASYDLRPQLPGISVPTLVVHRRDDAAIPVAHARYLAEHIRGAELAELAGDEHTYFLGDQRCMLEAIRAFVDQHVTGGAMRKAVRRAERRSSCGHGWASLTPTERELVALVAAGLTNKQSGERLRLSSFTVDGRLRTVFSKLGVGTRTEVAASTRDFATAAADLQSLA